MKTINVIYGLLIVSILFAGCDKTPVKPTCTGSMSCFNIDSFNSQIKRRLNGICVGYGYVISNGGNVHSFGSYGVERTHIDPPMTAFSDFDAFDPASLSKMITGITLLQELNNKGISINSPIYTYLPADWTLGPNIKSITFKNLLTHTSGIRSFQYLMDYPSLRKTIDTGVTAANMAIQQYDNSNFGIMRILIPRIDGQNYTGSDSLLAYSYGQAYESYVNAHIFSALSMPYLYCHPTATNPALCYHFPDTSTSGTDFGDFTTNNGQAGWNISVLQYAQVMHAAFFSTSLIPANISKMMRDSVLAFDFFGSGNTPYFNEHYVSKNGGFPGSKNPGEMNAQFTLFDNDVSIVLFVNSPLNYSAGDNIAQLVIDAFDASHP